jgi:hypothetical protein
MKKKTEEPFDMVKMAEEANRKKREEPQDVPVELRKQLVQEFQTLVSPLYDNHCLKAILSLKSYQLFEQLKIGTARHRK